MGSIISYQEAHGPVATFETDVAGKIKKIEASIEPIQDLNGYDSPWPAGGGKNLLNPQSASTFGTIVWFCEPDGFLFKGGVSYTFSIRNIGDVASISIYSIDKTTQLAYATGSNVQSVTFTPTENIYGLPRLYHPDGITQSVVDGTMLEVGSQRTDFAPYSNICPITGWTGAKVTRTGKNLLSSAIGRYNWASGVRYINNTGPYCATEDKVSICGGQTYIASFNNTDTTNAVYFAWFNGDTFLRNGSAYSAPWKATAPTNADGVAISIRNANNYTGNPSVSDVQLELGSTATAYEPYQGTTYDITFPSSAGTVYGGTLDVVSGELVVDRAINIIDGTQVLNSNGTLSYGGIQVRYIPSPTKKLADTSATQNSGLLSDKFDTSSPYTDAEYHLTGRATNANVYLNMPASITTTAQASAWFEENPTQLVYELATPVTYQLTPLEIQTIIGTNTIYADTGDTSVLYPKTITPVKTVSNISLMELRRNIITAQANDNLYDKWIWQQNKNDFIVRNNTAGFLEGVGNNIYLDQRENAENNRLNVSTKRGKVPLVLYNSTEGGSSTPVKLYPIPVPTNANNVQISSDVEDGEYGTVVVRLVNGAYQQMKLNPSWIKNNPKLYFVTGKNHYLIPYIRRADNADFITMPQNVQLTFSHGGQWRWTLTEENLILWKRNSYWDNTNSKICFYSSTNVNNYLTVCAFDGFCGYWFFDQPESMHNHAPIPIPPTATKVTVTTTPSLQAHLILLKCFDNKTQQFISDNGWKSTPVTMTFNADDNLELAVTLRVNSAVNDFTNSTTPTEIVVQFE